MLHPGFAGEGACGSRRVREAGLFPREWRSQREQQRRAAITAAEEKSVKRSQLLMSRLPGSVEASIHFDPKRVKSGLSTYIPLYRLVVRYIC
jgi:hypothetical protein